MEIDRTGEKRVRSGLMEMITVELKSNTAFQHLMVDHYPFHSIELCGRLPKPEDINEARIRIPRRPPRPNFSLIDCDQPETVKQYTAHELLRVRVLRPNDVNQMAHLFWVDAFTFNDFATLIKTLNALYPY